MFMQATYPLMEQPYCLQFNYKEGTSSIFVDPSLMQFEAALEKAHNAWKQLPKGILDSIDITCGSRVAVVVYDDEKHFWPDCSYTDFTVVQLS